MPVFERKCMCKQAPAPVRTHICITYKSKLQLGPQIYNKMSSNYHHSVLSLVCVLFIKVEGENKDKCVSEKD